MAITHEKLEARLVELKNNLEILKEQFAATRGAVADVEHWIKEFDHQEASHEELMKE